MAAAAYVAPLCAAVRRHYLPSRRSATDRSLLFRDFRVVYEDSADAHATFPQQNPNTPQSGFVGCIFALRRLVTDPRNAARN